MVQSFQIFPDCSSKGEGWLASDPDLGRNGCFQLETAPHGLWFNVITNRPGNFLVANLLAQDMGRRNIVMNRAGLSHGHLPIKLSDHIAHLGDTGLEMDGRFLQDNSPAPWPL